MQINIINHQNQDAYLRFGGSLTGVYNGLPLNVNDSYFIQAGHTLTGMSMTDFSGRMLFSLGGTLSTSHPDFQYLAGAAGSDTRHDTETRWDKVEMTLISDPTQVSVANLTATDFFSLRLKLVTYGTDLITPIATLSTRGTTADLFARVGAVAGHQPADMDRAIVPADGTVATGVFVPSLGKNVLRVIAPSTLSPDFATIYQSPTPYIEFVQQHTIVTHVAGTFSSISARIAYDFQAVVQPQANGTGPLVLTGSITPLMQNGVSVTPVPQATTLTIAAADLPTAILTQNPSYTIRNTTTTTTGVVGDNDVYAAAIRDIVSGFGFGFVGSSEINPYTNDQYRHDSTGEWYDPPVTSPPTPRVGQSVAYAAAQPNHTNPAFYSEYGQIFAQWSDAYGFPFTDLLGAPLADINPANVGRVDITLLPDTDGSQVVTPCFAAGTPILTTTGEIPVERLRVGMKLPTVLGRKPARIAWIGHRHVACWRHPRPEAVWPVRVARDAFGPGMPARDILLSPDHAVFMEGVLIPVRYLVNAATIRQEPADEVTYWHVELAHHDVILAAGLPAETFLDAGNRSAFANGGTVVMAHPDFSRWAWEAEGCAPLVITGPEVDATRARLARQAKAVEAARRREPDWMGWMQAEGG